MEEEKQAMLRPALVMFAVLTALTGLADRLVGQEWTKREEHLSTIFKFELEGQIRPERLAEFEALPVVATLRVIGPRLVASLPVAEQRFWIEQLARVTAWRDQRLAARI